MSAASGPVAQHVEQSLPYADPRSTTDPRSTPGRRSAPWRPPDLILLIALIRAGHDAATIGRMLGRTDNAVAAAAHRFIPADEEVTQSDAIGWLRACLPGTEDAAWLPNYRKRIRQQVAAPAAAGPSDETTDVVVETESRAAQDGPGASRIVRSASVDEQDRVAGLDHLFRNPQTALVINNALRSFRQPEVAPEPPTATDDQDGTAKVLRLDGGRDSGGTHPPDVDVLDLETAWMADVVPIIDLPQLTPEAVTVPEPESAPVSDAKAEAELADDVPEMALVLGDSAVTDEDASVTDEDVPVTDEDVPATDDAEEAPAETAPPEAVEAPYRPRHRAAADAGRTARCDAQDVAHGLAMALDTLQGRLGPMLTFRLGLRGTQPATLQELAEKFLLSREGVRDLQLAALDQLAEAAGRRGTLNASVAASVQSWLGDGNPNGALAELAEDLFFERVPPVAAETLLALAGHGRDERLARLREFADWQQQRSRQLTEAPVGLMRHLRLDTKIAGWFGAATWPAATVPAAPLPPWNDSVEHSAGTSLAGDFRSAKLGRDVRYASQLEFTILGQLERSSLVADYVEQPLAIEFTWTGCGCAEHTSARSGCRRTYRPDVVFQHTDGRVVLAEIKPVSHFGFSLARAESDAGRRYAHQHGWGWVQLGPDGHVADLAGAPLRENVRSALDAALQGRGCLRWGDVLQLRLATPLTSVEVAAYAVQRNLRFLDRPYQLVD